MEPHRFYILAILLSVFLSGVVAAAEATIAVLGHVGVARILDDEKRRVRLLEAWRRSPERVASSMRLAVNFFNLLAAALVALVASSYLSKFSWSPAGVLGVAVGIGLLTFLVILIVELVPNAIARRQPRILLFFFPLARLICIILTPLAWILHVISSPLKKGTDRVAAAEDELESMLKMTPGEGGLSEEKRELLSSIIDFSETLTLEILVPRTEIIGFDVNDSFDEIMAMIRRYQFSRYPVYEGDLDSIVGILTVKDVLEHLSKPSSEFNLRAMASSHKLLIVPETKRIGDLLKDFQRERVQMAIAVDEFGGTAGIVTTEDVVEEIVGDIWDEHEKGETPINDIGDGRYVMEARVPIEELEELFDIELPEQDIYETVGGLVMTQAGRVPKRNDVIEYEGLRFEVRDCSKTRVISLLVSKIEQSVEE
ncbi:MAG TPA: hemolysin family protein [Myxococcota bacterium]|nr:hemolysin family protein [Myxococcota bacterium]